VSRIDLTLLTFASFVNVQASYRIGPNAVDLEGLKLTFSPVSTKASTKHHLSIGCFALKYLLYVLDCALKL
jgi:hypothetical protein